MWIFLASADIGGAQREREHSEPWFKKERVCSPKCVWLLGGFQRYHAADFWFRGSWLNDPSLFCPTSGRLIDNSSNISVLAEHKAQRHVSTLFLSGGTLLIMIPWDIVCECACVRRIRTLQPLFCRGIRIIRSGGDIWRGKWIDYDRRRRHRHSYHGSSEAQLG